MIKEIRAYIRTQIANVDSDLKENNSAFYDGDIGETIISDSYQIVLNNISNELRTEYREDDIDCIVSIFGFGYRDEITHYDELLDKAICIRDNIININNFSGNGMITNIESNGITATQLSGDDNGFKIDINLTIRQTYL
tara:strand:- start:14483 stop:14899 length:417 start_codon:yes stop_codon:yes gene_type:complete